MDRFIAFADLRSLYLLFFMILFFKTVEAQEPPPILWDRLKPYFTVPSQYKDDTVTYRPVLRFYNGQPVHTKADWRKRRQEIYDRWMALLGQWPAIIRGQQLKITATEKQEGYTQYTVSFRWLPNEQTYGYLLVPDVAGRKPAVISVYYEPETAIGKGKPDRDFALQLAKKGFVTLSLGTARASKKKTYSLFYPDINNAQVQPLSLLAYAAANAFEALALHREVDPKRIGIVGHSFGGKWALFASCLYQKFACAVWSDPGVVFEETRAAVNYWEPYYLGYHPLPWRRRGVITSANPAKGLYVRLRKEGYNLHELHALMAPRPFLVSGGSEDPANRWTALNSTVAVNCLLGYNQRVGMSNRPLHAPNAASNTIVYSFFEYFLKRKSK